jgi:hypothetical protein
VCSSDLAKGDRRPQWSRTAESLRGADSRQNEQRKNEIMKNGNEERSEIGGRRSEARDQNETGKSDTGF